tara:strand:+ start:350 stop:1009 length:660 start_codon:yes stop_codon:yes gene_type:complete
MRVLVFDVETTGLPKSRHASIFKSDDWPYIVQLSYIWVDLNAPNHSIAKDFIIKIPDSVELSEESIDIHGITREIMREKGVSIKDAINAFNKILVKTDIIIAHNLAFDKNMIQVEAHRNTLPRYTACVAKTPIEYCTMKNSKDLCNILAKSSYSDRYYVKYPKLAELHEYLFGSIPTGLHNSMIDVIVCLKCYLKLVDKVNLLPPIMSSTHVENVISEI